MKPAARGADDGADDVVSEPRLVFERFRRVFGDGQARTRDARSRAKREPGSSAPFGQGRDAHGLGDVLDAMTSKLGWDSPLARSDLLTSWVEIAGGETAEHSSPISIEEGVMTVRCDSTAWATQLRLMRSAIMVQISTRYPDAGVVTIRFEGPGAPSWKRGPRSIPGRGPRDTYG